MSDIEINGRKIGDGHPCYITFEAGPTHDGVESAIELVKIAAKSGADAIKFQIIDPERLVADKNQLFEFDILLDKETGETKTVKEPLYNLIKKRSLSFEEWRTVKAAADDVGIAFFSTVGFEDEIGLLTELGCDSIKIASADLNHYPLLRLAAKSGMLVQLDTGNGTLGEVEKAVDILNDEGCERILIHQCPSGYPAHLDSIHLNMITTIKQMFPYPAAFSDHTPGWHMDVAAVALGANLIEKTITKDRCTPSVEHIFSLEEDDAKEFVRIIREVETGLGSSRRSLHPSQRQSRNKIRRSAFLTADVKKGEKLSEVNIEYRRPGDGIAPDYLDDLNDLTFSNDLKAGHKLAMSDLV